MSQKDFKQVMVLTEMMGDKIAPVSSQIVSKAKELAVEINGKVACILLGKDLSKAANQLITSGADIVFICDDFRLQDYGQEVFMEIIVPLIKKESPEIFLIGSTTMGKELAPLIAAKLKTGLTAHCVDLKINEEKILDQFVPAFGGMMTIQCPNKRPQMSTIAPGVFPDPKLDIKRTGVVGKLNFPEDLDQRIEILDVVLEEKKKRNHDNSPLVIAGGAGAGDDEGWKEIVDLAVILNAGLGGTRPAVDKGWIEINKMIGQSGITVNPILYLGIGISGDLQHMVGIKDAKIIVAINSDPNSPIFEQADYGIVADCRQFVPLLITKIKEYQNKLD